MKFPKFEYIRSEAYRRYTAAQPCLGCSVEGWSNACHPNQAKYGKGRGIKAGDQFVFPLCVSRYGLIGCHGQLDMCIEMTKAERDALEDEYVARHQANAAKDGWHMGRKLKAAA